MVGLVLVWHTNSVLGVGEGRKSCWVRGEFKGQGGGGKKERKACFQRDSTLRERGERNKQTKNARAEVKVLI